MYRRVAAWLKLPNEERLKKFKRIIKTEKRLNFVKQRFGAPSQGDEAESTNITENAPNDAKTIRETSISPTLNNDPTESPGNQLEFQSKLPQSLKS